MINNPEAGIRTNYQLNDTVPPKNMNAITQSIQYDYVVTADMLAGKSGNVDVDALLGVNKIHGIASGEFHVLINAVVPDTITLVFPDSSVGEASGNLRIHVHTIAPFHAVIGANGSPFFHFYFHTHGPAEAVTIESMAAKDVSVGAFIMATAQTLGGGQSFTYESTLDKIPVVPSGVTATVRRTSWMSNATGGGTHAIVALLDYSRIGPVDGLPTLEWPLYGLYTYGNTVGAVMAEHLFPASPAPGKKEDGYLVPRAKPAYNGDWLPSSLINGDTALVFREPDGTFASNSYIHDNTTCGFVLADSFIGCEPRGASSLNAIKIGPKVTQLDMYITCGFVLGDTGLRVPQGSDVIYTMDVSAMEEGQVIELNMHIVSFPPAKQALHSDLGLEHFVGEWDAAATYASREIVSVETQGDNGPQYSFYISRENNNSGNTPASSVGTWWDAITPLSDNKGLLHAATPHNGGPVPHLWFQAGADTPYLKTYSWGYGNPNGAKVTSTSQTTPTNHSIAVTFNSPEKSGYGQYLPGEMPTIPIAASAKLIFTKVIVDGAPAIILLTGGYCCQDYPNY
jgi:hypothetical protein